MISTSIYSDILKTIRTTEEAAELDQEIEFLLESLFKVGKSFDKVLAESVRVSTASAVSAAIANKKRTKPSREEIGAFLEGLRKRLQEKKRLRLTLAFEPSESVIDALAAWTSRNLGEEWLLEFSRDDSVVGGCVIEQEGRYADYSVRKRLDEEFATKKDEIMAFL